jgi:hypothetical protein
MNDKQFYDMLREIVREELKSQSLLDKQWHHGLVESVDSSIKLKVFVDGSEISQTISCNPDVSFSVGDQVWVIYINGNPRDKFVLAKRGILTV